MDLQRHFLAPRWTLFLALAFLATLSQCTTDSGGPTPDPDNGGLFLPGGFEALVVADSTGRARHLAVNDNGDIYVKLSSSDPVHGGIVALRDNDHDGRADVMHRFGAVDKTRGSYGTAMTLHRGYLYFSSALGLYRYQMTPGELVPAGEPGLVLLDDHLYLMMHGRDNLYSLFPDRYTPWQSALLPAEEFIRIEEGADYGWPYCYYDQLQGKKVLAPEYGGDGRIVGRCAGMEQPLLGFPGHWAPNDLLFYRGDQFPERYKHGAFIAFHGSTNRAPYPQAGYFVCFVPFANGAPTGEWEVFADGFPGVDPIVNTSDAQYRPVGLAEGPDGSLYITESRQGKIWRVLFNSDREAFGTEQLAPMEARKAAAHLRTPDEMEDDLQKDLARGEKLYNTFCGTCHQADGRGAAGRFPPLTPNEWVSGDKKRLIRIVLEGMQGEIEVDGELYNNVMPPHNFLKDEEIAIILTYIRSSFSNTAGAIGEAEVQAVRNRQE